MKKIIAIVMLFIGFGISANAQQKIGYISGMDILKELPSYAQAQDEITEWQKLEQKKIEELYVTYQNKMNAYRDSAEIWPKIIRESYEKELVEFEQRIQEKQNKYQEDLQIYTNRYMEPISKRVEKAIKKIAVAEKFSYVMDKSNFAYFEGGVDITEKVTAEALILDKAAMAEKAENK